MAAEDLEWERSKISNQDMNLRRRVHQEGERAALPKEESYPSPPMEYRVSFVDHLIRGLSPPIHEFLRGLLFVYGLQLHQLTPNSILHVSIFITLCECFLGVQPNWALWKRIFCLRRNGSHGVAYNIGGVVICVRSNVEYFDVKFPDSVQGWRKRWLYVHEESSDSVEYNIAPFDGRAKILRRRSWDAEATEEEKSATEALMTRIHELQNTRGKELSGIQITAYFLRIRVQPLQARKNPLWMYAGDEDVERLSKDLPVKDLEKLIRRISKLNKKDTIPSSCRVKPFSSTNPLPENHPVLASLPPLPEGGEVEERAVITDDNQGTSRPDSEVAGSQKSVASSEKEIETEATASTRSSLPAASPKNKRKRDEVVDSGTSKAGAARAGETAPDVGKRAFNPYEDALVSSGDEDENTHIDATARMSTSRTLVDSEAQPDGDETSPPRQNTEHPTPVESPRASSPKRARVEPSKEPILFTGGSATPSLDDPLMKEFIRLGTQFVGYRDSTKRLEENLAESNKRADALAIKLEQSEKARKKAEADAATVEDLRKRLHDAETSLSENIAQQSARETEILTRLESQSRCFVRRTDQEYELDNPEGDQLLDALSLLEIHGDEAREGLTEAKIGLSWLFPYFFKKKEAPATFSALAKCFNSQEDLGLQLRQEGLKVGVEGTIALVADIQQEVDWARVGNTEEMETKRWQSLIKAAKPNSKKILAYLGYTPTPAPSSSKPEVLFWISLPKINVLKLDPMCFSDLPKSMVPTFGVRLNVPAKSSDFKIVRLSTMFPRNEMPETLSDLMDKFRDAPRIHGFVRAQLSAGARFAMMMIKISYPKFDMSQIVTKCLAKMAKRKRNVGKIDDIVTPVAEDMMDELLRMDAEFFVKGSYAEHSTRTANNERMIIDDILGST
ncbi:hypothetical protein QYE76_020590 [Lolium multiflorum]|uniref:Transposase (putative) gypsy type domain-containing protein n=1 Tax=Lolium multiflorum TaxID=4521 RepID=A0AAD8R954_LOLMU|nr:hypothetical protein QYE76_020590 [Lolium multiflorum]